MVFPDPENYFTAINTSNLPFNLNRFGLSAIKQNNDDNYNKNGTNSKEDDEKWDKLARNHHELCDLDKCMGRRINGLYVCQFSNIPGSLYSQYLRHRRRKSAFKTKACRNYFGTGFCYAGDNCTFYHSEQEKRELPQRMQYDTFITEINGNDTTDVPNSVVLARTNPHVQWCSLTSVANANTFFQRAVGAECDFSDSSIGMPVGFNAIVGSGYSSTNKRITKNIIDQFSKSFHPFSESYPLKNVLSTTAVTPSKNWDNKNL